MTGKITYISFISKPILEDINSISMSNLKGISTYSEYRLNTFGMAGEIMLFLFA